MQDAQVGTGIGEHGSVQTHKIFHTLVFHRVLKAFLLHTGNVQDVCILYLAFQLVVLGIRNVAAVKEIFVFLGDFQIRARYKIETGVEMAHGLQQRVYGSSVFKVSDYGYGQIFQCALGLAYGIHVQ